MTTKPASRSSQATRSFPAAAAWNISSADAVPIWSLLIVPPARVW